MNFEFKKESGGWRERLSGLNASGGRDATGYTQGEL
jgi:hypothetical protein